MWIWCWPIDLDWPFNLNKFNYIKKNMIIKKNIKKIEKELKKKIDITKNFALNNIDSLDLITIAMLFEKDLKIKISEDELSKIRNFNQLEKMLIKLQK